MKKIVSLFIALVIIFTSCKYKVNAIAETPATSLTIDSNIYYRTIDIYPVTDSFELNIIDIINDNIYIFLISDKKEEHVIIIPYSTENDTIKTGIPERYILLCDEADKIENDVQSEFPVCYDSEILSKYDNVYTLTDHIFIVYNETEKIVQAIIKNSLSNIDIQNITIGFFGQASHVIDNFVYNLENWNPRYKINPINYGDSISGITKLLSDIRSNNPPDLIISEGYTLPSCNLFTDLYPYLDTDSDISRSDFLPHMLDGLEKDGKLFQIWGSIGLSTAIAKFPLSENPEHLKLETAQSYLEKIGYSGLLFDPFYTRMNLLSALSPILINDAYNCESEIINFEASSINNVLNICRKLPKEIDYSFFSEDDIDSNALIFRSIDADFLRASIEDNIVYRFFDGIDNSDNYCTIAAYYRSCYMIPASCCRKDIAWNFLKELLQPEYQIHFSYDGYSGYPTNLVAYQTLVNAYITDSIIQESINRAINNAVIYDYDMATLCDIFNTNMEKCLDNEDSIEKTLSDTESRMNIYLSERK